MPEHRGHLRSPPHRARGSSSPAAASRRSRPCSRCATSPASTCRSPARPRAQLRPPPLVGRRAVRPRRPRPSISARSRATLAPTCRGRWTPSIRDAASWCSAATGWPTTCSSSRSAPAHAAVPGAVTFAGPAQAAEVAAVLDRVERGEARRLVFAVPAEATWSLPVYELAIMAAVDLRDRGVVDHAGHRHARAEPLRLFGAAAGEARCARCSSARHRAVDRHRPLGSCGTACSTSSRAGGCAPTR